ncbi:E3 ubiquitin-protein ligase TRIM35-like [Polymixia lowei]
MASKSCLSEEDCTCPVCCDIFRDPVVLLCGHSFCKDCLQEWWRQSRSQTCPVCKEMFPMRQPPRNLALRNLSDTFRQERSQRATAKKLCSLHNEKFKLFCLDDQQPICVVCRDAKKHKKHDCVPINEVTEEHKTKLKITLMHLKSKLGAFNQEKLNCDKMANHIQLQTQKTVKRIKGEFQRLYRFLRAEEATRIDALSKEAIQKNQTMAIKIANLTTEISSLSDTIKVVEEELKAKDLSFMLNFKSTMERAQCTLPDPETPSGALIDEAKHLGNLLFNVWGSMKGIIQYTPVVLDPNTTGTGLITSEHLTSVTESDKAQPLPYNPERCSDNSVLGSKGFTTGSHSWEVEVNGGYWAIGVAVRTKRSERTKNWCIYLYGHLGAGSELCEMISNSALKVILRNCSFNKIRVQLDYDQGKLSFYAIDSKTHVHTITHIFKEPVFPYFQGNAKILPVEISLVAKRPR